MERLKKIGALPRLSAKEIEYSRLGIGFEKLDRDVFDPEKATMGCGILYSLTKFLTAQLHRQNCAVLP